MGASVLMFPWQRSMCIATRNIPALLLPSSSLTGVLLPSQTLFRERSHYLRLLDSVFEPDIFLLGRDGRSLRFSN